MTIEPLLRDQANDIRRDRERIARALHDNVLSELTGIVLAMQRARQFLPNEEQPNFDHAMSGIDSLLRSIRGTVYDLAQNDRRPVAAQLRELVTHFNALLPQDLSLATSATIPALPAGLRNDIVAVATEALTNAAKYSDAEHIDIDLTVEANTLRLLIVDDGAGLGDPSGPTSPIDGRGGNGLRSMALRAERNGGTFRAFDGPTRGTVIEWLVPMPNQPAPAIRLEAQ